MILKGMIILKKYFTPSCDDVRILAQIVIIKAGLRDLYYIKYQN